MEKLGFPNQWLMIFSALYNSTTSRVLVVGDLLYDTLVIALFLGIICLLL